MCDLLAERPEQLVMFQAPDVRSASHILDLGWGKPAQTITATVNEKRSALDWTTSELVTYISERRAARERIAKKDASDTESDQVDECTFERTIALVDGLNECQSGRCGTRRQNKNE
jgi:hypothetical protein